MSIYFFSVVPTGAIAKAFARPAVKKLIPTEVVFATSGDLSVLDPSSASSGSMDLESQESDPII